MIDKAVCNVLIPFRFAKNDWDKIENCQNTPQMELAKEIKENNRYDSREWFAYCFDKLPAGGTIQLAGSPLLDYDGGTLVKKLEFTQPVRAHLGLHQKENRICILKKGNIPFRIGKIRLLFFKTGAGMVHLSMSGSELSQDDCLDFCEQITAIRKNVKFSYENRVAEDTTETVTGTIKKLVEKILSIQTYIPLSQSNIGKAYIQTYITGSIEQSTRPQFFEMLRNQRSSSQRLDAGVDSDHVYKHYDYITWIIGERTLICYSDTGICGDDNLAFLTEPGGLVKSIEINYVTIYAYLIGMQLLTREAENNRNQDLIEELRVLPVTALSGEPHINEMFDKYLCRQIRCCGTAMPGLNQSRMEEELASINTNVETLSEQVSEMRLQTEHLEKQTEHLVKQVDHLVAFTNNELKSFLDAERSKLKASEDPGSERQVGAFIEHASSYIDQTVAGSGDELVHREQDNLISLFGERWNCLLPSSQTSLISAGVLLKKCMDIRIPNFDYSGICICATAALEAELKKVFFEGLINFMVSRYGDPRTANADDIYRYWPDRLLTVPKYRYMKNRKKRPNKESHFTMGALPFLFGELRQREISKSRSIRESQFEQARMMRERMTEYLSAIVLPYYSEIPFDAFCRLDKKEGKTENYIVARADCFVGKCEDIRTKYRNKAAHTNTMSEGQAFACYQSVITELTKPDLYIYNAEVTGAILELYSKIDAKKLKNILDIKQD